MYLDSQAMADYFNISLDRMMEIFDYVKDIITTEGWHSELDDLMSLDVEFTDTYENVYAKYIYALHVGAIRYRDRLKESKDNISRTLQ